MDRKSFIENQEKYCKENYLPFFMPSDGHCWSCGTDITKILIERGNTGDKGLITGCPSCHRSYCD